MIELKKMTTEGRNTKSEHIDTLGTLEILKIMNSEDKTVPLTVEQELPKVALAVDAIASAFLKGGRLFYLGAGTSGRLGILDASECPPTFGTPESLVVGLIAGGHEAIFRAVESAEDNPELAKNDLKRVALCEKDVVVGLAASGRTPYVIGGLELANTLGATTVSISCNADSPIAKLAKIAITPVVGPEVITGSSRLKAGTAQKLILNMLTSAAMIKTGKVYGNLMVDVQATNLKLIERQKKIVMEATGVDYETAQKTLEQCANHCKAAIVMILLGVDAKTAEQKLVAHQGFIRQTLA